MATTVWILSTTKEKEMASAASIASLLEDALGGSDEQSTVTHYLDTGYPPLNHALTHRWDGGLPVKRIVEIYGPESSGKTALATMAMADAQRQGGFAGFSDHERSFDEPQGINLGLSTDPNKWLYKKPRTFEESLSICVKTATILRHNNLIPADAPIAWVFDSLAFMVPNSALFEMKGGKVVKEKDTSDRSMHDNTALARATSAHFPAFAQHCEDLNICAIFLNQIRMNIGVTYGNPETTPGGKTPKYVFSQRIALGSSKITKGEGANAVVLGAQITAKVVKNKVSRPFETAKWRFEFQDNGQGHFAVARSLIEFLAEEGILKKAGAYIQWTDGKKYFAVQLAKKIEDEGLMDELKALLPDAEAYEAPVDVSDDAAGTGTSEDAAEAA
jgi:recombination protein RecA